MLEQYPHIDIHTCHFGWAYYRCLHAPTPAVLTAVWNILRPMRVSVPNSESSCRVWAERAYGFWSYPKRQQYLTIAQRQHIAFSLGGAVPVDRPGFKPAVSQGASSSDGFLLNTHKTLFGLSRILLDLSVELHSTRRRGNKICTCSLILGELESQ